MQEKQKYSSRAELILSILIPLLCFIVYIFHGSVPSILVLPGILLIVPLFMGIVNLVVGSKKNSSSDKNPTHFLKTLIGELFGTIKLFFIVGVVFQIFMLFCTDVIPSSYRTWMNRPFRKVEFEFSGCDVVVDSNKNIYVLIGLYGRVQKYDWNGKYQTGWFSDINRGHLSIAIDSNDRIYLRQGTSDTLVSYDKNGNRLKEYPGEDQGYWRLGIDGEPFFDPATQENDSHSISSVTKPGERIKFSGLEGFSVSPHETLRFVMRPRFCPSIKIGDSEKGEERYLTPNFITFFLGIPYPLLPVFIPIIVLYGFIISPLREKYLKDKGFCPKCGGNNFKNRDWQIEHNTARLRIEKECLNCKNTIASSCSKELQETFNRYLKRELEWDLIDKATQEKRIIAFGLEMGSLIENEIGELVEESDFVELLSKIDPQEILKRAESGEIKNFIKSV